MKIRPVLSALLLALSVAVGPLPPGMLADEPSDAVRGPIDAFVFDFGNTTLVPGSQAERDRQYRSMLNGQIDALKDQLTQLHLRAEVARDQLQGSEHVCERREISRHYESEKARLRGQIAAIRDLRGGDARKFLTRLGYQISRAAKSAWYRVGPFGRKVLRELGDEAYQMVNSGGTLQGGAARRLILAVGRKHTPELLVRALTRKARQADARALAAAAKACDKEQTSPAPEAPLASLAFDSVCGVAPEAYGQAHGPFAPLPPYDVPATLIYVDWAEKEDVNLTYGVVREPAVFLDRDPVKDPAEAAVTAGCSAGVFDAGGIGGCWAAPPIVLTESEHPGAWNWAQSPGAYLIALHSPGACWYRAADGEVDWSRIEAAESREGPLEVTATVAHFRAGEAEPYLVEPPLVIEVPRGPTVNQAIASEGPIDMTPFTRFVELLLWNPDELPK